MTVWVINPFDNLPTEGCRAQRYWLMAEAFVRAGHEVLYWTSDFSHARKAARVDVSGAKGASAPFPVIALPTKPYAENVCWARVRSHRRLARDFERRASGLLPTRPPALVIASTPPLGLCAAALRIAHRCGAKFVCDIQDAWPETFARLLPRGLGFLAPLVFAPLGRTARRLYRSADFVTGVSRRYAALAGRADYHLAYHGIAAEASPARRTVRTLPPRRLVYLGNLGAGYDLATAIAAVGRRADLSLDIAGKGPREAALRAAVASQGLEARVRFHGYLGAGELEALLARCDAGLIPMRDDSWVGLPYKLCDYLKAGLPVLSSLGGECGELLVRSGVGATYAFGDPGSLLRALDSLPTAPVGLPVELRAERIYSDYVGYLTESGCF